MKVRDPHTHAAGASGILVHNKPARRATTGDAKAALQRNKQFRWSLHKEYKPSVKIPKGGRRDPDLAIAWAIDDLWVRVEFDGTHVTVKEATSDAGLTGTSRRRALTGA